MNLSNTFASPEPSKNLALSLTERSSLRYRLENIFNEVDLLIRNQRADLSDVKRQERDLASLKVFERIPFQRDIPGLKKNLLDSSSQFKIKLTQFKVTGYSKPGNPVPKVIYTDSQLYRLQPDQITEKIFFKMVIQGPKEAVSQWIKSWRTEQMRLVELDTSDESQSLRAVNNGSWEIKAHGFRFKDIQFPNLTPRNPRELLPTWAKKDSSAFSVSEPLLWSYVTRIEALAPKARPYYKNRGQFLLNDARMNFFLSKASPLASN